MTFSKIELGRLLSVYGDLLTQKQKDAVAMYCDCDCTLSEIADESGISRQGVRDALIKAENTLNKLEENLHLAEFVGSLQLAIEQNDNEKIVEAAKKFVADR